MSQFIISHIEEGVKKTSVNTFQMTRILVGLEQLVALTSVTSYRDRSRDTKSESELIRCASFPAARGDPLTCCIHLADSSSALFLFMDSHGRPSLWANKMGWCANFIAAQFVPDTWPARLLPQLSARLSGFGVLESEPEIAAGPG